MAEHRLANDALQADFELEADQRQVYEAISQGAEGDYMSGDDRDNPFVNAARGRDACGINLDEVSDSDATGYVPPIDYSQLNVGSTPTSGRQQAIAEAEATQGQGFSGPQIDEIRAHLNTITGFIAKLKRTATDASAYDDAIDACYELSEMFRGSSK